MAVSVAVCELISVKTCEIGKWVRGRSRSLKIAPPRDVFLTASARGYQNTYCMGKKPFLFLLLIYMRFLTTFYAKTMGLSFIADYDSERVCRWGVFLDSVRPTGSIPFDAFPF